MRNPAKGAPLALLPLGREKPGATLSCHLVSLLQLGESSPLIFAGKEQAAECQNKSNAGL